MSILVAVLIVVGMAGLFWVSVWWDKRQEDPVARFIDEEKGSISGMKRRESKPGVLKRISEAERIRRRG